MRYDDEFLIVEIRHTIVAKLATGQNLKCKVMPPEHANRIHH